MIKVFTTPYVYTTPLMKPIFNCNNDKIKVAHIKQKLYSFDEFSNLEIESSEINHIPYKNGYITHRHIIFKEFKECQE